MFSFKEDNQTTPSKTNLPPVGKTCLFLRISEYEEVIKRVFNDDIYPDVSEFGQHGLKIMYCEKPNLGIPRKAKWLVKDEIYASLAEYFGMGKIIEITEVITVRIDGCDENGVYIFYKNENVKPCAADDEIEEEAVQDESAPVYEAKYKVTARFKTRVHASSSEEAREKADEIFGNTDFGAAEDIDGEIIYAALVNETAGTIEYKPFEFDKTKGYKTYSKA